MELVDLANQTIDSGELSGPSNRITNELTELADDLPDDAAVHEARSELIARRRNQASSLMAKEMYEAAARDSAVRAGIEPPPMGRRG